MIPDPTQETVKVADLQVDQYVQRTYNEGHAKAIADGWSDEQVGIFKVSKRKSGLWVLDGQHRRAAMHKLDMLDREVLALVYEGLTPSQEAQIFLRDNVKNRKPNTVDIFRLSVVAEDPTAVEIEKVLKTHGLHVALGSGPTVVSAVGALTSLYERGGISLIDRVLTITEVAWGADTVGARDGNLLKGLGYVLTKATGAQLDIEALAYKLGSDGKPSQLVGKARTHRAATGAVLWREIANVIVAVYNRNRTTRRVTL